MYKLLIVDDERHIVNWLYELFVEDTNLDVDVYKAYSGVEALNWLNRTKIDIVVSDILMPQMSGLELMEKIHGNWPQCKVIFLTGYNEFDYVYQAIKHEGISYLLKTEDDDVIIEAVSKAITSLERSSEINTLTDRHKNILDLLQQKEILLHIVNGDLPVRNNVQKTISEYNISLSVQKPVILLLARIVGAPENCFGTDRLNLLSDINMIFRQYLSYEVMIAQVDYKPFGLLWIMQPAKDSDSENWEHPIRLIRETLETIQSVCEKNLNIKLPFLLNSFPVAWESITGSVAFLESQTDFLFGNETGIVLTQENLKQFESDRFGAENCSLEKIRVQLNKVEILRSYLEQGQQNEYDSLLDGMLSGLTQSKRFFPEVELYYTVALMLLSYINRCRISEKLSFNIGLNRLMNAEDFQSWDEAKDYLRKLSCAIFELQQKENEKRGIDIIAKIQQYIGQHLGDDLSLVRIAEYANYNPSYLSRVFKKVTGSNLYAYINNARLEKAAELLKDGKENVYQIAQTLGFGSSQYFSTIFKKTYKITPQEYRNANTY